MQCDRQYGLLYCGSEEAGSSAWFWEGRNVVWCVGMWSKGIPPRSRKRGEAVTDGDRISEVWDLAETELG